MNIFCIETRVIEFGGDWWFFLVWVIVRVQFIPIRASAGHYSAFCFGQGYLIIILSNPNRIMAKSINFG